MTAGSLLRRSEPTAMPFRDLQARLPREPVGGCHPDGDQDGGAGQHRAVGEPDAGDRAGPVDRKGLDGGAEHEPHPVIAMQGREGRRRRAYRARAAGVATHLDDRDLEPARRAAAEASRPIHPPPTTTTGSPRAKRACRASLSSIVRSARTPSAYAPGIGGRRGEAPVARRTASYSKRSPEAARTSRRSRSSATTAVLVRRSTSCSAYQPASCTKTSSPGCRRTGSPWRAAAARRGGVARRSAA